MTLWKAEIEKGEHYYIVRCGERYEDHLTWDEALGVVARLILQGPESGCLRTQEQHDAWKRQLAETNEQIKRSMA